jgi:hypothetical protein
MPIEDVRKKSENVLFGLCFYDFMIGFGSVVMAW